MSDAYYRDTKKALEKFSESMSGTDGLFSDTVTDAIGTLENEVEMLLVEYKEALEEIESLRGKLDELEELKCQE